MTIEPLLVSATRRQDTRHVNIGAVAVGGDTVPVIAGPCAVEPGYVGHAIAAQRAGASALRGCVLKPRTRPGSFQGLGTAGLPLLDEARRLTGLPVIAEPLAADDIELLRGHADALLIGARSMHNTPLLRAAGQSGMTVILKRGMSATYDEWLAAADYITTEGNPQVILCERGIRTFETATRNTLDVTAIAVLRDMTDLPIAVDPSHAAGKARWVPSLAVAALAAGADALLIECHPDPASSLCDAAQAITPSVLERIVQTSLALCAMTRPAVAELGCRMSRDDRHHRRRRFPDARVPRRDGRGSPAAQARGAAAGARHRPRARDRRTAVPPSPAARRATSSTASSTPSSTSASTPFPFALRRSHDRCIDAPARLTSPIATPGHTRVVPAARERSPEGGEDR